MEEKEIKGVFIFEMLGRPPEHLKDTLTKFIDRISEEKDIEVLNRKISEPRRLEESQQELYTIFAETEIGFKEIKDALRIIFTYMPSNVEIIEPREFKMKNFEINNLMNELIGKLHQYDEIAKRITMEKSILQRKLQELQGAQESPESQELQESPEPKKIKKGEKKQKRKKSEKSAKKFKKKLLEKS